MNVIRIGHFYFGIIVIVLFLGTGQFMHHTMDHLVGMEFIERALLRAGHIYILLFGLIHVTMGSYFELSKRRIGRWFQLTGSITMLVATCVALTSFFKELPTTEIERPLSRLSLYLMLAGVLIQALGSKNVIK